MKKLLLSLILLSLFSSAWAESYQIGDDKLNLNVAKGWTAEGRSGMTAGVKSYALKITPEDGNSTLCLITAVYAKEGAKKDKKGTETEVRNAAETYLAAHKEEILEKKIVLKEFKMKKGFGFYTTSTDPKLVGKPVVKGDWKTSSSGMIDLADNVRLAVTIMSDDVSDAHFKQALDIVQSATLDAK